MASLSPPFDASHIEHPNLLPARLTRNAADRTVDAFRPRRHAKGIVPYALTVASRPPFTIIMANNRQQEAS